MQRVSIVFFLALLASIAFVANKLRIEKIIVVGDLLPTQREQLENNLVVFQNENFLFVSFPEIQKSLEALSWADTVRVKRVWPRKIKLQIEKNSLIAKWNNEAYLSSNGDLIYMDEAVHTLPTLRSISLPARESLEYFRLFQQYAKREGLDMMELAQEDFGDWRITFKPGWHLLLRSDSLEEKMESFLEVYSRTLKHKEAALVSVDARYDSSYAVQVSTGMK
jgi:cell division protein FtsQ